MSVVTPKKEKPRSQQTVRDLLISMAVVGGFVAFLYLIVLRPSPDPVRVVEVTGPAATAAASGAFTVLVPELPPTWRATSARYVQGPTQGTGSWFNGYVDPTTEFVAVAQRDYETEDFIAETTENGKAEAPMVIDGTTWVQYSSPEKNQRSLVLADPQVTTIVTGTVSYEQLADFARKLRPVA